MKATEEKSPVSFDVHVGRLPPNGLAVVVEAGEAQREALAKAHGLVSVESYRAEMLVTAWKRNGVKIAGQVRAAITQACVVTLAPIETGIDAPFEALFVPHDSGLARHAQAGEILLDADGPDSPETFSGDTIDAGALAEEFFELAIDPYPRKPGAVLQSSADDGPEESEFQKALRGLLGKD